MNIIKLELKKILLFPALIGFVILALALNILVITTTRDSYTDFIAEATRTTGVFLGAQFDEQVLRLESSLYANLLREQTANFSDVLYGYTTNYIADIAVERLELSGLNERLMRLKYEHFQHAVNARQEAGDSMTLYFAEATYMRHQVIFNYIMGLLLFQGIILATLIVLFFHGYENAAKTEYVVYATKTGRKLSRHKLLAGIVASLSVYAILSIVTLTVFFAVNPMGGAWGSSVSSGFNFVRDGIFVRPFVTWFSFTVAEYMAATLALSLGVVLCFTLIGYTVGLWIRNSYIGFLVIIILNVVLFLFPFYSSVWTLNFIITQSPIWLVLMRFLWFTDGGSNVILPYFETIGVMSALAVLSSIGIWSESRFKRRNLV